MKKYQPALLVFSVLTSAYGLSADARASTNELRSGHYQSATLCSALIRKSASAVTVTLSQCHRSMNGRQFSLAATSEDTFETQGMRLEIWGPTTALITAYGVGQILLERD